MTPRRTMPGTQQGVAVAHPAGVFQRGDVEPLVQSAIRHASTR